MNQSSSKDNAVIIAALISGVFVCVAAIVGLGAPFMKNLADRVVPTFTSAPPDTPYISLPVITLTASSLPAIQETPKPIITETMFPSATNTAVPIPSPTQIPSAIIENLGLWEWGKSRPPMPEPAGLSQVIFAHGDIDNSGTCHVKEFGTGVPVEGLGNGTFRLVRITGTQSQIMAAEFEIQTIAANGAGGSCPRK